MSFYDLTKDFVLSAKELFKYRVKRDNSIPSRGGHKEFEPDGSWMQAKALEVILQERMSVLAEPRVEKLKSLVEGVWDKEKGLVNLKKPGKFWSHMGFTDKRRNWLYPEEALFLMEANTLEVYHEDMPLSIQEGYHMFIGAHVSLEEYQVFSHLRRLGYVVLRHEEQSLVTPYERQINLDKYISKQGWRDRKEKYHKMHQTSSSKGRTSQSSRSGQCLMEVDKARASASCEQSSSHHARETDMKTLCADVPVTKVQNDPETEAKSSSVSNGSQQCASHVTHSSGLSTSISCPHQPGSEGDLFSHDVAKKARLDVTDADSQLSSKECDVSPRLDSSPASVSERLYSTAGWDSCLASVLDRHKTDRLVFEGSGIDQAHADRKVRSQAGHITQTVWDSSFTLPDIAGRTMVCLANPNPRLLPPNVGLTQEREDLLMFDVEDYRLKNPCVPVSKQAQREEEREARIQDLTFSFAEWTQRHCRVSTNSWAEYNQYVDQWMTQNASIPVRRLWQGDVTPLLRPEDARSYEMAQDRLSIIKTASNDRLTPDSDCVLNVKVSYDVHLPDNRFRKSMPGVPNHRVCVTKCVTSDPPGLADLQQMWARYKDDVPLHWAVVDAGDIAFYVFDASSSLSRLT